MADFKAGDVIGGDYEVLGFIGAGGMGDVYRVRHKILESEYALKTLHENKVTPVAWKRFQTEAQAIARLSHPNIVAIYNLGIHEGRLPFYVMDILIGSSLQEILAGEGRIALKKTLRIFIDACSGIAYAHKKGIVHRDIKPPNIVLLDAPDAGGSRVKIVDFGIAKLSVQSSSSASPERQQLTQAGEVFGSPFYMSPEQCEGGEVDERSDIYSLGCSLFEALTGVPPFRGRSAVETMLMHQKEKPPTLASTQPIELIGDDEDLRRTAELSSRSRYFPDMLEMVVATMLAKNPAARYQNVERLVKDLRTIYEEEFSQSPSAETSLLNRRLIEEEEEEQNYDDNAAGLDKMRLAKTFAAITGAIVLLGAVAYFATSALAPRPTTVAQQKADHATEAGSFSPTPSKELPLSKLVTNDNQLYYEYNFPVSDEEFGFIVCDVNGKRQNVRCRGKFRVPASQKVAFAPGTGMAAHPEYFRLLAPEQIQSIDLEASFMGDGTGAKFDDRSVDYLLHFKDLRALSLSNIQTITDRCLSSLSQLKYLETVHIKTTNITASGFSRMPYLANLRNLAFWGEDSITPVLKKLEGSKYLTFLDLTRTQLSAEDYRLIGTMRKLDILILDGCSTTDEDVKAMVDLRLGRLNLNGNALSEAGAAQAKNIVTKGTKELILASGGGHHHGGWHDHNREDKEDREGGREHEHHWRDHYDGRGHGQGHGHADAHGHAHELIHALEQNDDK